MPNQSKGRYSVGSVNISHKSKKIPSVVGSREYERFLRNLETGTTYTVGYVPIGYEHRPDLIANLFLGSALYWWVILEANNIVDPFDELNVGDRILIPGVS